MQAVLPARTLFGAHHHFVVLIIALVAVCPILLIGNFRCGFAETRLLPLASHPVPGWLHTRRLSLSKHRIVHTASCSNVLISDSANP